MYKLLWFILTDFLLTQKDGIEVFATLLMNMLVGHSHVTETSRERGLLPKGVWRARRVTMRQCVVKCARLSRGSPKGGSINLFPDGAWSRIGGVGASTSCWGTGGGMEQKLTLTGLTRLRTSVETVPRKADGWSGGAHNCGVDDDGAPSSLVRNAWVLTERFRWTRVPQRLCAHDGHQRRARRGTKVLQWKNGPITNACFFFIELRCLLYCLNIGVYCA